MSVVGKNRRTGAVDSSFFWSSRFSCTCSSCPLTMVASSSKLGNLNRARLVAFGARNEERQNPVAVLGLDPVGVDADGKSNRAIKRARDALAAVQARFVLIGERTCT